MRRQITSVSAQIVEVDGQLIRHPVCADIALMGPDVGKIYSVMKRADAALYVANTRREDIARSDGVTSSKFVPT